MTAVRFKVGDRVRYVGTVWRKLKRGTVTRVREIQTGNGGPVCRGQKVYLRLDGGSPNSQTDFYQFDGRTPKWEVVPAVDWTLDETAKALAEAVLKGDLTAARALNDRLTELFSEGAS